jgi:heat shock protein HslJ
MKKIKILTSAFLLLFVVVLIQTKSEADPKLKNKNSTFKIQDSVTSVFPDSSRWILTKMVGLKSKKQHTGMKTFIVIKKLKQKIAGYSSCNSLKGKVIIQDSTISISGILPGDRVCDDKTVEREKLFREILQKSTTWKINGNMLYLYENGKLILEFTSASEK